MHKRLINWYLSRDSIPYWYVLLADCLIVLVSGIAAYAFNHGAAYTVGNLGPLAQALCVYLL